MNKAYISIRPHHFTDIMESFGRGERSFRPHPTYGHGVHTISECLLQDKNVSLKIVLDIDDICRPCIHNVNNICDDVIDTSYRPKAPNLKNDWMRLIDPRWCDKLKIKAGAQFSAYKLCERIRAKIRMRDFIDVYHEIPASMTEQRYNNLVKGLEYYLDQNENCH